MESIVLGGGCFWCLEAVYQRVNGVRNVINGYADGDNEHPSYEEVSSGTSGHAEVVKIEFDPNIISLKILLQIFWVIHDPTTLNQQGADIGPQYRSIILYKDDNQKKIINTSLKTDGQPLWSDKIVTQIKPLETFWPAEEYHQNYFNSHPERAYCQIVINPKITKLKNAFAQYLIA